jgi:hypothetical protein
MGKTNLESLIERARSYVMTPEERRAQKISWVAGELGIEHPELTPEECRSRAEAAMNRLDHLPSWHPREVGPKP